ncbi:RipA family octameric membrane protein [Cedecea sp. NFIX57]|uniref:RipA family octameric membrane protein n=1 Tax=Cedecea sp. NFIX57 TaxID=1566286 RepID=UPI000A0AF91D|nr:hypothetical protein [Cedecea sp. NFIX57]SMG60682.1 hypothetical protein SAMN03159353_103831 [Cedecea sp. NFIX57]
MNKKHITIHQYREAFKRKQLKEAFEKASDIRKFEIELYWKRTSYFWTLISVAFAGYFAVIGSLKEPYQFLCSWIIASIGFVFTISWLFANRGSKHWLENWENHIDLLEDKITGPLYKTVFVRSGYDDFFEKHITGPKALSVSKINQWVAVFVSITWFLMLVFSGVLTWEQLSKYHVNIFVYIVYVSMPILIVLFICFIFRKSNTHMEDHHPYAVKRETTILPDSELSD